MRRCSWLRLLRAHRLRNTHASLTHFKSVPEAHKPRSDVCTAELPGPLALQELSEQSVEDATSAFADAVLADILRRFWCYELIGPAERAKLREALDGLHRVDVTDLPMSRTLRRILLDERDAVRHCPVLCKDFVSL